MDYEAHPLDHYGQALTDACIAVFFVQQLSLATYVEASVTTTPAGKAMTDKMLKASTAYLDAFKEAACQFKMETNQ